MPSLPVICTLYIFVLVSTFLLCTFVLVITARLSSTRCVGILPSVGKRVRLPTSSNPMCPAVVAPWLLSPLVLSDHHRSVRPCMYGMVVHPLPAATKPSKKFKEGMKTLAPPNPQNCRWRNCWNTLQHGNGPLLGRRGGGTRRVTANGGLVVVYGKRRPADVHEGNCSEDSLDRALALGAPHPTVESVDKGTLGRAESHVSPLHWQVTSPFPLASDLRFVCCIIRIKSGARSPHRKLPAFCSARIP